MIKYAVHTIMRSSSDHKEIIPIRQEAYSPETFYAMGGKPTEHFSFCRYQLNIGILPISYAFLQTHQLSEDEYIKEYNCDWQTLALVTNSTTPYLRVHFDSRGKSYPNGRCEIISEENPYTRLEAEQRNKMYPIVAYGIAAIFAWNLDYNNDVEDFLLACDDVTLMKAYYLFKFNEYLSQHRYRKYAHLSDIEKEYLFVQQHIKEEQENWSKSSVLELYPLLYQYTKAFTQEYIAFIELKQNELNNELAMTMPITPYKNYSNVISQFDNLPDDRPKVFISYSWDNEDHKKWVRKLSDDLRTVYGICTFLDQYNRGGMDLISFMNKGISLADRVLLIGTPIYKEKTEKFESGGARYEDQLITIDIYHSLNTVKFVPILRRGQFSTSFAKIIETRTGYDFRDDSVYCDKLKELAADILNQPLNAPPPVLLDIEKVPLNSKTIDRTEYTRNIFIQNIKSLISNQNIIDYTELIENEGTNVHNAILDKAHYDFSVTLQIFQQYCKIHLDSIDSLIRVLPIVIRYAPNEFLSPYINVMVRLCTKPFKNGERICEGTQYLHFCSAMFLYHAFGILCVKYNKYAIFKELMKTIVPAPNPIDVNSTFSLAYLAGTNHWDYSTLNNYMGTNLYYPYSQFIRESIFPYISNSFLNKNEFESCYTAWEHLFSLMFHYYNCYPLNNNWFPQGEFIYRRADRFRGTDNFYTTFLHSANKLNKDWEPIKQGLFNGKYEEYQEVYNQAEKFYNQNIRI